MAFITKRNNPKVKKVTGNVNNTKTGFTKRLSNPRTMATIIAVVNCSTTTPFIKQEITITKTAVIRILSSSFIN